MVRMLDPQLRGHPKCVLPLVHSGCQQNELVSHDVECAVDVVGSWECRTAIAAASSLSLMASAAASTMSGVPVVMAKFWADVQVSAALCRFSSSVTTVALTW